MKLGEDIKIRISKDEKDKLQLLADKDKRSLSSFIRKIISEYIEKEKL